MNVLISTVGVSMYALCGIPISVILFLMISTALGRASMFGKSTSIVVALCTTFLCMVSLYWLFVPSTANENGVTDGAKAWLTFWLFPYAVLTLVVLLLSLFIVLKRMFTAGHHSDLPTVNRGDASIAKTRLYKASQDGPSVH